jgi:hypothetical protein
MRWGMLSTFTVIEVTVSLLILMSSTRDFKCISPPLFFIYCKQCGFHTIPSSVIHVKVLSYFLQYNLDKPLIVIVIKPIKRILHKRVITYFRKGDSKFIICIYYIFDDVQTIEQRTQL